MHEHVVTLQAPSDQMLYLWFEPWGDGLGFSPSTVIELQGLSRLEGKLEIDRTEERIAVYGWPGSILRVFVNGEVICSFDQAVPSVATTLSVKETITMLFGVPPVPTAQEEEWSCKKNDGNSGSESAE